MGFVKAFSGAVSGSFADQWIDFYTVPEGLPATVGMCKAIRGRINRSRSSNQLASDCIITNGSRIVVPEGYALITLENGMITGFVSEPGGYIWNSSNGDSKSIFAGDSIEDAIIKQSVSRFAFGGVPSSSQIAVYVNLKEIPNLRFGTQNELYWDDAFLHTQVGVTARGVYTLKIVNPVLFLKSFVPADYYSFDSGLNSFDFADYNNDAATQIFSEIVSSLLPAFSAYAKENGGAVRISALQSDPATFAKNLSSLVEDQYAWSVNRGIMLVKASIISIDYDQKTKELVSTVQRADALRGSRGVSNLQASFAEGIQHAGANADNGAMGMAFMNMAMSGVGGVLPAGQQNLDGGQMAESDPYEKLERLKGLLDKGVISQEDFDSVKRKTLGI